MQHKYFLDDNIRLFNLYFLILARIGKPTSANIKNLNSITPLFYG